VPWHARPCHSIHYRYGFWNSIGRYSGIAAAVDGGSTFAHAPSRAAPIEVKAGDNPDARRQLSCWMRMAWLKAVCERYIPTLQLLDILNSGRPLDCIVGVCERLDEATLDRLYLGGKCEYLKKFEASLSSATRYGR
jgi:hypothetical protein